MRVASVTEPAVHVAAIIPLLARRSAELVLNDGTDLGVNFGVGVGTIHSQDSGQGALSEHGEADA